MNFPCISSKNGRLQYGWTPLWLKTCHQMDLFHFLSLPLLNISLYFLFWCKKRGLWDRGWLNMGLMECFVTCTLTVGSLNWRGLGVWHILCFTTGPGCLLLVPNIFSNSCYSVWLAYHIDTWHTVYALQSNVEGSHDNAVRVTASAALIHVILNSLKIFFICRIGYSPSVIWIHLKTLLACWGSHEQNSPAW